MLIAIEASHANKQNRTGVENVCFNVIQELKNILPSETKVILYSNKPLEGVLGELPNNNWSVKILKWPFGKGWSQVRLSWEFLLHKPDVFLAPGQLVPVFCPKNTITIVHDSAFKVFPKAYWWASRWYLKLMNWLVAKKSKIIITPSQFSKDEFLKFYKFNKDNIRVVEWGYDKNKFKVESSKSTLSFQRRLGSRTQELEVLDEYNIKKPYIISIGRLEEKKNTQKIVQAFNLLKSNLKQDLQLVLVGSPGVGYEKIKKEIDNSPYKDNIILPGYVAYNDLPALLQKSEVFIFPSLYEGFGLPVLEAMACGCPVIASRGNCLEEVGATAVEYVKYDDIEDMTGKINKLVVDREYRQSQIDKGLMRVEQFSWDKTGEKIYEIIKKLV